MDVFATQWVCFASVPGVSAGWRLTLTLTPTLTIVLRSCSVYNIAQRRHHAPEVLGTCSSGVRRLVHD
jgi:hypothetical protein